MTALWIFLVVMAFVVGFGVGGFFATTLIQRAHKRVFGVPTSRGADNG